MDRAAHANVPAGTLTDLNSGGPVTVRRDYTAANFPAMKLDLLNVRRLMRDVLPKLCEALAAAEAEEAAEAAGQTDDAALPDHCAYHGGEGDGLAVTPCPGGCGCRLGTEDADARECGCDGGCCDHQDWFEVGDADAGIRPPAGEAADHA